MTLFERVAPDLQGEREEGGVPALRCGEEGPHRTGVGVRVLIAYMMKSSTCDGILTRAHNVGLIGVSESDEVLDLIRERTYGEHGAGD